MSQAAYMNGYDDGYEDARKEFAKAGGSGSESGDSSSQPTRGPGVFTLSDSVSNGAPEMDYEVVIYPLASPDMGVVKNLFPTVSGSISGNVFTISPPEGGWMPGDMLLITVSAGEGAVYPMVDNSGAVVVSGMQAIVRGKTDWMSVGFNLSYADLV